MKQSVDIPLHDIMPLVNVPDTSIYWFSALGAVIVILLVSSVIFFRQWKKNKTINERQQHYDVLQKIDLKNPKESAYTISREGYFFADDNERTFAMYQNLFERLEKYKYAKSVENIDEETVDYYKQYLKMIEV